LDENNDDVRLQVKNWVNSLNLNLNIEPDLRVELNWREKQHSKGVSFDQSKLIVDLISKFPNGIQLYSKDFSGAIETSSQLGTISTNSEELRLQWIVRSLSMDDLEKYRKIMSLIGDKVGATTEVLHFLPSWNGNPNSKFILQAKEKFDKLYQTNVAIKAINAGMEPSHFYNKSDSISIYSLGADIENIHSVDERVEIESVDKLYRLMQEILQDKDSLLKLNK